MTKIPNTFFSAKIFLPLNKKVQYMQIILFHISMFLRILTRVCDPKDMFRSCLCVCVCVCYLIHQNLAIGLFQSITAEDNV